MARKTNGTGGLTAEYIEVIRVKPEDTEALLASLPYTITPRPDEKPPRGMLWCPYDAQWSQFIANHEIAPNSSYYRCTSCGISVEDFYVKTANKLWGDKTERKKGDD